MGGHDLAGLYDLETLNAEGERLARWIESRIICADSPRAAFIQRMNVGGRVAQFIGHDPRLPSAVWGGRRGMSELIKAFRRFEHRVATKVDRFVETVCETPN
jgi:DNA-binding transcriptional regulator PaaX